MTDRPSVLCPVDFSEASRGALRYAVALAEHFYGSLTVATVNDPLLARGAATKYGQGWLRHETEVDLDAFVRETLNGRRPGVAEFNLDVGTGKPALQILGIAEARTVDLIVMSTHGLTGARKFFLGSTTERLLRETRIPVLVTPANAVGPESIEAASRAIRCVLAPVDLSEVSQMQIRIASGLAEAFGASLVLAHVLELLHGLPGHESFIAHLRASRRVESEQTIRDLMDNLPPVVHPSLVTASGDPAEQIIRLTQRCNADLVVMGLHTSVGAGPRMGSVTYRVLTRTQALVVAVPPHISHRTARAFTSAHPEEAGVGGG